MEMVLVFLGFFVCFILFGYGLYYFVRYMLKKEKCFFKKFFWLFLIGGLVLFFIGVGLLEFDVVVVNVEKKYLVLYVEYKSFIKEYEVFEKEYKFVSFEVKKLKNNIED